LDSLRLALNVLHLRFDKLLHLALMFITFTVGITLSVVITFSGDTAMPCVDPNMQLNKKFYGNFAEDKR